MRVNLRILSVTCVSVAMLYHLCLSSKGPGFEYSNLFYFWKNVVTEFSEFSENI